VCDTKVDRARPIPTQVDQYAMQIRDLFFTFKGDSKQTKNKTKNCFLPHVTSSNKTPSAQRSVANAARIDKRLLLSALSPTFVVLLLLPICSSRGGVGSEERRSLVAAIENRFGADVDAVEFVLLLLDDTVVVVGGGGDDEDNHCRRSKNIF
jgi:hypothetical protein